MNNEKIIISSLMLEVTRECNMCCNHCLRGAAQDLKMSKEVIDAIFEENISRINSIGFSGGEPSLAPDVIEYFIEKLKTSDIIIGSFFVATNGFVYNKEFAHALLELYSLCEDKEWCTLALSSDDFHEVPEEDEFMRHMEAFTFLEKKLLGKIIDSGNAFDNGLGEVSLRDEDEMVIEKYGDSIIIREVIIYIAANGNILLNCNYSYDMMDDNCKYNILTHSFEDVIKGEKQ